MTRSFTLNRKLLTTLLYTLAFWGGPVLWQTTAAQSGITTIFTHPKNATTSTTYTGPAASGSSTTSLSGTFTYKYGSAVTATNNTTILDSFTAFALNYYFLAVPQVVKFRRVDNASVTGNRKCYLIEQTPGTVPNGGTASLLPEYDDSVERVFCNRMLNIGIDNLFQNINSTNNLNVERMDVLMPNGVSATDNTKAGFAVFDRGNGGSHDVFYIAAIKTLDASGNPSDYYNAVSVGSGAFGSNVVGTMPYILMRQNPGETKMLILSNNTPQNRDGTFLRFIDLGVPANTMIYGYSLFAPDTDVSPAINMVDYTNSTNFPTTTTLGSGGLDPLAVTGLWVANSSYVLLSSKIGAFNTVLVNGKVKLNWQLHTDDVQQVAIERSTDGVSYSPLLSFATLQTGQQSAFDVQPVPGKNYYRLKLVAAGGQEVTYSGVSTVDVVPELFISLQIYPNPVQNKQFSLYARGLTSETYELRLFDIRGNLVLKQALSGERIIQKEFHLPSQLSPGIYVAQLADNKGKEVIKRTITVE